MRPYAIVAGGFHREGGMDLANLALARGLARRGHEVHAVCYRAADELASEPNVHVHLVPKPLGSYSLGRPLLDAAGRVWGRYVAARGGRVVVNGGNCHFGDINWVHYVHSAWRPRAAPRPVPWLKRHFTHWREVRAERAAFLRARLLIANSERTRRDLVERLGVSAERIHTVYCGSEPERFHPPDPEARAWARRELGCGERTAVVAFVGALGDRRKGFDTLYEAWRRLCARPGFDGLLLALGGGDEVPHWLARARADGLASRVRLLGFRSDVAALMAGVDAMVAPTRYEAFGVAVVEALCCEVPTWVSRSAGVAERYPEALSELLLPDPEDAEELARRLWRWHEAPERYRGPVSEFARTLRGYTWDDMATDIISVLEGEGARQGWPSRAAAP